MRLGRAWRSDRESPPCDGGVCGERRRTGSGSQGWTEWGRAFDRPPFSRTPREPRMLERLEDLVASSESLPVATIEFGSRCPEIGQVFNSHAHWWRGRNSNAETILRQKPRMPRQL